MRFFPLILLSVLGFSSAAYGNIMWPEMFVAEHVQNYFWLYVGVSLLIEWPFFKLASKEGWLKSCGITLLANGFSSLFGTVYVLMGFGFSIAMGQILYTLELLKVEHYELLGFTLGGTFGLIGWIAASLFLGLFGCVLELGFLALLTKAKLIQRYIPNIPFSKANFKWIFIANLLTGIVTILHLHWINGNFNL